MWILACFAGLKTKVSSRLIAFILLKSRPPNREAWWIATLTYFKRIIWYSAFVGPETYTDATGPIHQFVQNGGNIFINTVDIVSPPPIWFPFDSTDIINPSGRLFSGTTIKSSISTDLDLESSKLIAVRLHSFSINDTSVLDPVLGPSFTPLYRLPMPTGTDPWIGTPIVAAKYDHRCEANEEAGEVVLFTIPLHDGASTDRGTLEGSGSAGKFISYVLRDFTVGVKPEYPSFPDRIRLYPAYPNPFNPSTTLRYELPHASEVTLIVYDLLGREVAKLVDGYLEPGYHQTQWSGRDQVGRDVPSGIYIARLVTHGYSKSIKMVLLK